MRPMTTLVLATLMIPSLAACHVGDDGSPGIAPSGSGSERTFAATGFNTVELAGPDDIDVKVGGNYSVSASGDPKTLDKLKIERRGDKLYVGRRAGIDLGDSGEVKIHVTLPALRAASLAGSGDLSVDRAGGSAFDGSIAGSGNLSIGELKVGNAGFSIAGSGDIDAAGQIERLSIKIAGSGDVNAEKLRANAAEISIAGSGGVKAAVSGPADIKLLGSGDVDLGPDARCTTKSMGSGTVRCGGD